MTKEKKGKGTNSTLGKVWKKERKKKAKIRETNRNGRVKNILITEFKMQKGKKNKEGNKK